jgi:hypothetical protein
MHDMFDKANLLLAQHYCNTLDARQVLCSMELLAPTWEHGAVAAVLIDKYNTPILENVH